MDAAWPWALVATALLAAGVVLQPAGPPIGYAPGSGGAVGLSAFELGEPPTLEWSADLPPGVYSARVIDGVVITGPEGGLQGRDLATGEPLWDLALPTASCQFQHQVTCVVPDDPMWPLDADGEVWLIEPRTGAISVPMIVAGAVGAYRIEDDLVLHLRDEEGQRLTRLGADGESMWTTPVVDLMPEGFRGSSPWMSVGGRLYVQGITGQAVIDPDTGEILRAVGIEFSLDGQAPLLFSIQQSIGVIVFDDLDDERPPQEPGPGSTLIPADGSEPYTIDLLVPDDDIGGQIRLGVDSSQVVTATWDATDATLWTMPDAVPQLRLAGVALVWPTLPEGDAPELRAVDAYTGEILWAAGLSPIAASGSVIVAAQFDGDRLEAVDVRTGETLWDLDGLGPIRWVETGAGVLVSQDDTTLSLLSFPPLELSER